MSNFWRSVISTEDTASSKRLVTLLTAGCFFIAQFLIIFISCYVIFYTTRGKVDKDLLGMLKDILEYDFYIILGGLGFITADNFKDMLLEKAKNKVAGNVLVGAPSADKLDVSTVNINQTTKEPEDAK